MGKIERRKMPHIDVRIETEEAMGQPYLNPEDIAQALEYSWNIAGIKVYPIKPPPDLKEKI